MSCIRKNLLSISFYHLSRFLIIEHDCSHHHYFHYGSNNPEDITCFNFDKFVTLPSSQGWIFHSGSPGEKARLISKEGSIHQSANPSIIHTEFDKAATCLKELQFPVIYARILELTLNICSSNNLICNGVNKYTTKITTV